MAKALTRDDLIQKYWVDKKSTLRIATEVGVSHTSVCRWMIKHHIPRRSRSEAVRLASPHPTKKSPCLKLSEDLAYMLGVVLGDGCIYEKDGIHAIKLKSATEDFNRSFERVLIKIGLNPRTYYSPQERQFQTWAYSVVFTKWFKNLTLNDAERLLSANKKLVSAFLRGFYESEGSTHLHHRGSNTVYVEMSNTNKNLLELVKRFVESLGFQTSMYDYVSDKYSGNHLYTISILGSTKEKKRFLALISPCIKMAPLTVPR